MEGGRFFFRFKFDAAEHGAFFADFLGEGAGVEAGDAGDAFFFEPVSEGLTGVPMAVIIGIFADDDAF